MGLCECIYCIWMESLRLCTGGHRCLHVDTCPPRYGHSCVEAGPAQTENAAARPGLLHFRRPLRSHPAGLAAHSRALSQFPPGCGLTGRQGDRWDRTGAESPDDGSLRRPPGCQELGCRNPSGATAGSGSPAWAGGGGVVGRSSGGSRSARPRAPGGGVRAACLPGGLGAGRLRPQPGVCLPTNGALRSDAFRRLE